MSNRVLVFVVAILALCVGLAATNPAWSDYLLFLEKTVSRIVEERPGGRAHAIEALLQKQNRSVIDAVLRSQTQRRDYGLFSLYETRIWDVRFVVLGLGGQFIPLEGVEEARKKFEQLKAPSLPKP